MLRRYFVAAVALTVVSFAEASWDDPLDPIVIATESVASGRKPILRVLREAGPGGWQLYDGGPLIGNPVVVPKVDAMKLDPSLYFVRDLPVGWEATRQSPTSRWMRAKAP